MKPFSEQEIVDWIRECRSNNLRVGYTCGSFDILHAGHVDYLQKARALCDRLIVAVNSDRSVRTYKSPLRPINPEGERAGIIGALRCVDAVTLLDDVRPLAQLQRWKPDLYIKGGDYGATKLKSADAVRAYGGDVALIPIAHATSTTLVIQRIVAAELHAMPEQIERQTSGIVFLDRDGTLIPDVGYLRDPTKVELLPGVGVGLAQLQNLGLRLVIVTNQQGIGLGYYSEDDFIRVNQELLRLLTPFGVRIDRILFCPHSFADNCECRKPGAQLLIRAMEHYKVSSSVCFMIGDRITDVEAGQKAGCRSILLGQSQDPTTEAVCVASFGDAVERLLTWTTEASSQGVPRSVAR